MTPIALFILVVMPLAFTASVFGWVAVSQIRRSQGRLYGLRLAVFDALLFPLLVVDVLEYYLAIPTSNLNGVVLVCVITDIFLIRWVWRAVNKGRPDTTAQHIQFQPDGSADRSGVARAGDESSARAQTTAREGHALPGMRPPGVGLLGLGILSLLLGPFTAIPGLIISRRFRPFSTTAAIGYFFCWFGLGLTVAVITLFFGIMTLFSLRNAKVRYVQEQVQMRLQAEKSLKEKSQLLNGASLKAMQNNVGQPPNSPAVSEAAVSEPPQLRYLAWQDEVQKNPHWQAWQANGEFVKKEDLHLPPDLETPRSVSVNIRKTEAAKESSRFLCIWISHPAFDGQSVAKIKLLDEAGKPLETPTVDGCTSVSSPSKESQNLGWFTASICAGSMGKIPPMAKLQLSYSAGPWQHCDEIPVDFHGIKALRSGVLVTGPGQEAQGITFIELRRDHTQDPENEQFDFVAVMKDGRRLDSGVRREGGSVDLESNETERFVRIERFVFNAPLDQIKTIECRKRPINTMSWTIPLDKAQANTNANVESFGPVVELDLPFFLRTAGFQFLSFKNGKVVSPPAQMDQDDIPQWLTQNSIDASADELSTGPALASYDYKCVYKEVESSRWLLIQPEEVVTELQNGATNEAAEARNPRTLPATFLFKTRDGSMGIVQLLSINVKPRGVKIRYKLLQNEAALPAAPQAPDMTSSSAPSLAVGAETKAAVAAAQNWLAGIDTDNYSQSWKDASPFFQAAVTEQSWNTSMASFRKPLGDLVSRKLQTAQSAQSLPGAPDGEYVVMQFDTSFTAKKTAVETVTFSLEKDGKWRASGYFIK